MAALQAVQQMCMHVIPTTASKAHACASLISYIQGCTLATRSVLVNVSKCPAKSIRKPPVCNFRASVCIHFIFSLG